MGFMDKINEIKNMAVTQYSKIANKKLMEGTMAACALVANANGVLKDEEMTVMTGHIGHNESLKVYDIADCIGSFKKYNEEIKMQKIIGEQTCLAAIQKCKKNEEARVLVAVCCAIAGTDGNFDDNEKAAVKKICNSLGINPSEFDI